MQRFLSPQARDRLEGFRGRRVGVVGLGREGVDLVRFLSPRGADIAVSDCAPPDALQPALQALRGLPVSYLLGQQEPEDLLDCTEIFVSPGVPRDVPVVAEAARAGIALSSATRLFFEICPGSIAGLTGSSGKTTTTALLGEILHAAGKPVLVGGNIGVPLLGRLPEITPDTWCLLELSSFQLEDMTQSPPIGVVLNITPNHLDRHPSMDDYVRAKGNLVRFQGPQDVAILNADDPISLALPHGSHTASFSLRSTVDGAWLSGDRLMVGGEMWLRASGRRSARLVDLRPESFAHQGEIPLRGLHNVANVLAAAATALTLGCSRDPIARAVRAFKPVPHRLEVIATIEGVLYVNDSIATSPERSMAALHSFDEPIVLIAGGRDKHLPMEEWASLIGRRAKAVVLVGEAAPKVRGALDIAGAQIPVSRAGAFADAVPLARSLAEPGDVVLLSPGCTSFDEFRDFEARGEAFRAAVRAFQGGS